MKKINFLIIFLLILSLIFTLCCCNNDTTATDSKSNISTVSKAEEFHILDILYKDKNFLDESGNLSNINDFYIPDLADSIKLVPYQFMVIDLDHDGFVELAVSDANIDYILIFRYDRNDKKVYSYSTNIRGFQSPKVNGTLQGSNGADDNKIFRFVFNGKKIATITLAWINDIEQIYQIDGSNVNKSEAEKYFDDWSKLDDAQWVSVKAG